MSEYEHMLISAVRYALGRRTYIVGLTVNYVIKELPRLSDSCKKNNARRHNRARTVRLR